MKKFTAYLVLAVAFGAVLAGCSGGEKTEEPAKPADATAEGGAAAPAEGGSTEAPK